MKLYTYTLMEFQMEQTIQMSWLVPLVIFYIYIYISPRDTPPDTLKYYNLHTKIINCNKYEYHKQLYLALLRHHIWT